MKLFDRHFFYPIEKGSSENRRSSTKQVSLTQLGHQIRVSKMTQQMQRGQHLKEIRFHFRHLLTLILVWITRFIISQIAWWDSNFKGLFSREKTVESSKIQPHNLEKTPKLSTQLSRQTSIFESRWRHGHVIPREEEKVFGWELISANFYNVSRAINSFCF